MEVVFAEENGIIVPKLVPAPTDLCDATHEDVARCVQQQQPQVHQQLQQQQYRRAEPVRDALPQEEERLRHEAALRWLRTYEPDRLPPDSRCAPPVW